MARSQHQFSQTKRAEIPRSSFDLSHGLKTAFNAGQLVPILSLECLPGDTISCRASLFGRLATPIKPILDNLYLETFFFFTPYRQVWTNFVRMMGERINPVDSLDFTVPRIDTGAHTVLVGSVYDYMGLPLGSVSTNTISALPFRCHNHIYNNWFRDQNLIDSAQLALDDGPDDPNLYNLRRRRKRRDYLTSALPWPQKGQEVTIGIAGNAEITTTAAENANLAINAPANPANFAVINTAAAIGTSQNASGPNNLFADLSTATSITINALRESIQIQRLLERDARSGTRFPEVIKAHFGVTDPAMLVHQRPLFLGGGSSMINVNPVQQTNASVTDQTPQGNLAAFGTVSGANHGFTQSFTEHGHILGYVNVRADITYQQGIERYWSRQTRYDFFWPVLAHLGEQAILNKEIYNSNATGVDDAVFGYIPRYDEYRFKQSQITGIFRSAANASLDVWHLAQDFSALPTLNQAFIEDAPPIDRVSAVPSEPDMLLDVYFKMRAARPMPTYGTPGLMDHF